MSEPKFTEGPWEVSPHFAPFAPLQVKAVHGKPGDDLSQLVPAVVGPGINQEANGHLIASATDLYATVVRHVSFLKESLQRPWSREAIELMIREGKAELAKARGEEE